MIQTLGLNKIEHKPQPPAERPRLDLSDGPTLFQRRAFANDHASVALEKASIEAAQGALEDPEVLRVLNLVNIATNDLRASLERQQSFVLCQPSERAQARMLATADIALKPKRCDFFNPQSLLGEYEKFSNALAALEEPTTLRILAHCRVNVHDLRNLVQKELEVINARLPKHLKDGRNDSKAPEVIPVRDPRDYRVQRAIQGASKVVA